MKKLLFGLVLFLLPGKSWGDLYVASTGTHNNNCSNTQPCNSSTQAAKVARDNFPTHRIIWWHPGDYRSTNPTTAFSMPNFVAGDLPVHASSWFDLRGIVVCEMFSTTCAPIFNGYDIAFRLEGTSWTRTLDMFSQNTNDKALGWYDVVYSQAFRIGSKNCNTWTNNFGTCFEVSTADNGGNIDSKGIVMEDMWGVGVWKYGLMFGGDNAWAENIIARRIVLRWDGSAPTGNPTAGIVNYGATTGVLGARNNLVQNSLVFDFNHCDAPFYKGGYTCIAGYYDPHAATGITVRDSIALNLGTSTWRAYALGEENASQNSVYNSVAWVIPGAPVFSNGSVDPSSATYRQMTIGYAGEPFMDATTIMAADNQWYRSTNHIGGSSTTHNGYFPSTSSAGGDVTYLDDPYSGVDIMITSPSVKMSTRALNGHLGAFIRYRRGIEGTYWGQSGYDTITSTPLFNPDWPYANRIRSLFCSPDEPGSNAAVNNPENNVNRGWCGTNLTLAAYVNMFASSNKTCPSDQCIESAQGGGESSPGVIHRNSGWNGAVQGRGSISVTR